MIEDEHEKTERLIAKKRHDELKDLLGKLATALNKKTEPKNEDKKDNGISESIANYTKQINELVQGILSLPKPEKPQVNVDVSNDELASSIETLNQNVVLVLDLQKQILNEHKISNLPKKTRFDVVRNQYTQSVMYVDAVTTFEKPKNLA